MEYGFVNLEKIEAILGVPKEISEPTKKTDEGEFNRLSNKQIFNLAASVQPEGMIVLAKNYLNINYEIIEALQNKNRWDLESFNRDILREWVKNNLRSDQPVVGSTHTYASFEFQLAKFKTVLTLIFSDPFCQRHF